MHPFDEKINEKFPGLVVRKDLVKAVKGNAIVPTYVLEYLLGQYCATSDEESIQSGIETVREILRRHFVHRNEAGLVRSTIREKGRYRVIDKIRVDLNDKNDTYEATFSNLGISDVLTDADTIKKHPKLLVGGVWCIADLEYRFPDDKRVSPYILESIKPIQLSAFDLNEYLEKRQAFSLNEWIDLLLQSMGLNPQVFDLRGKLLQLMRLVPFCERNYNLIELGPKGTGKSHIYSEFSPHGILISGGEVTVPKLFVNNSNGKIGLVGYWDVVAFDEFAGKMKKVDKALVDILKNYMANKTFSRGIETLGAEASLAFVGNTQNELDYMLMHSDLFADLPPKYYDSAFLDRLHFYIPGWEVEIIRGEMFSDGYGFVVDYLAEILRTFRTYDFTHRYDPYFQLSSDISTRDRDSIRKTFSGLLKILFPRGEATELELEMLLKFAIEGRKRVKDQLMRIDPTYSAVNFHYRTIANGQDTSVQTLEEIRYPQHYQKRPIRRLSSESSGGAEPGGGMDAEITLARIHAMDVETLITLGEGKWTEWKSSLRWVISKEVDDRKVGLATVKTIAAFLNSEGGTVLVGVADNGVILGTDLDHFESDDKYLVYFAQLLNERLGPQYVDLIDWGLREVKGKKVLRVDCRPSKTPVFIEDGSNEEFYIRNGPSKALLSVRKALEYIKAHFG